MAKSKILLKSDRLLDSLASPYLTAGWYGLNFYRDKF